MRLRDNYQENKSAACEDIINAKHGQSLASIPASSDDRGPNLVTVHCHGTNPSGIVHTADTVRRSFF